MTTTWPTKYLQADGALDGAGLGWYEVSSWAASPGARRRHSLLYGTGGDWWGAGPVRTLTSALCAGCSWC